MEKKMMMELVTPERHVVTEEVASLVCPGLKGSFGVLPGHLPLVAGLKPGMLKIQRGEEEIIYAIGGGYAEVSPDKIVVLADTAELAEDIDIEAARKEKERALAMMKKGLQGAEMDGAEVSLKKALARLSVANVMRRRKGN